MRSTRQSSSGRVSRRAFLGKGGLFLAGLGLLAGRGASDAATAPTPPPAKPIDLLPWDSLRRDISGGVLRPGQSGYAAAAAPWNPRYAQLLPGGIARCQTPQDVQAALVWARCNRLPLCLRSGGHSLAGYSNTRGLMLDLSPMRGVDFNPESRLVTMQGGARVEDVSAALAPFGVSITQGRCPSLGLAGLILGGGLGLSMRGHGLTCDLLQQTEVVTSEGLIKTCSREQNEDLFWAARGGGGGNFAVHTSFTLKTFPVADIVVFRISWSKDLADVLPTLLSLLPEAEDGLGCEVSVTATPGAPLRLELMGQLVGEQDRLLDLLDPVMTIGSPDEQTIEALPYYEGQQKLVEKGARQLCQVRSRFAYGELPLPASDLVLERLARWPGSGGAARWKAFLMGGAIDKVSRRATAYVHRGASMLTSLELSWRATDAEPRVEANLAWLDEFHADLQPYTSVESYQNFSDPSQENYPEAYYGENLTYLTSLKRRLDPDRTFVFEQSIPFEQQV